MLKVLKQTTLERQFVGDAQMRYWRVGLIENRQQMFLLRGKGKNSEMYSYTLHYTQRQKLSTTNFVAKFIRARLCDVNKPDK